MDTITGIQQSPGLKQQWTLDQLGNWSTYQQDDNSDGTWELEQSRTHNSANELETISTAINPVHDTAGNMTTIPQPKSPGSAYTLTYDAWNRMVEVKEGGTVIQANEFDGLNRRIVRISGGETRHFYYNQQWQVLEERVGTSTTADKQYVYHPHYVDAIAMSRDASGTEHFYLQDANFNVTSVIDNAGAVVERYAYTPYGEVTILDTNFLPVPGNTSTINNELLYTGRRLDPETGLQLNRNRFYASHLGRWVNRDPIGYDGGTWNLYEYVDGMPISYFDPEGLFSKLGCQILACLISGSPISCDKAQACARWARKNNPGNNSTLHCLWQCCMVKAGIHWRRAFGIGQIRENCTPNNDPNDRGKDEWNNAVGRELGKNRCTSCLGDCMKALNNGVLR